MTDDSVMAVAVRTVGRADDVTTLSHALATARVDAALLSDVASLQVSYGAQLPPTLQVRYLRDVLQPVLDVRASELKRVGGQRTNAARWGSTPPESSAELPWWVAEGNFPRAILERLLAPGRSDQVIDSVFPLKAKSMRKLADLMEWAERTSLPDSIRSAAAAAVVAVDEGAPVDGFYKRVRRLVAEHETVTVLDVSREQIAAQHTVYQMVCAVTLTEDKAMAQSVEEFAQAARLDPVGQESWDGIVASARRLLERVLAVEAALAV